MKLPFASIVSGLLACGTTVFGLATEDIGPKPSYAEQPDWPKGIVEVARHPTRVYSIWVNGGETLYFQAEAAEVNQLIALFCKSGMRDHQIRIEQGPRTAKAFGGTEHEYNVSLQIIGGISRALRQAEDQEQTLEPILTLYTTATSPLLGQLQWPDNAIVHCELPGAEVKSKTTKPQRTRWYGRVQSADTTDAQRLLSIRITLWATDSPDGIQLTMANLQGTFHIVLSDAELACLRAGSSWLTVTVGNYLTQAKKSDTRFPVEMLSRQESQGQPLKLEAPKFYWGRILFEDGSPAVLDPAPWPGAEILADFPYAGSAHLDAQGYFKIYFTPEQFAQLKQRKPHRNIYVPQAKQGNSRASEIFPAEALSQDKSKAGVVKIPRPVFEH